VCVSSLLIAEIKRIIKDSEIMKYGQSEQQQSTFTEQSKGRRLEVAREEQGWSPGAGD